MTRNECYPSAPAVQFGAKDEERSARKAYFDKRNESIQKQSKPDDR